LDRNFLTVGTTRIRNIHTNGWIFIEVEHTLIVWVWTNLTFSSGIIRGD